MIVSPQDEKFIEQTIATPGWRVIVSIAKARIEAAKVAALMNTDESQFLPLYRKAHAAQDALYEFLQEFEQEPEPGA